MTLLLDLHSYAGGGRAVSAQDREEEGGGGLGRAQEKQKRAIKEWGKKCMFLSLLLEIVSLVRPGRPAALESIAHDYLKEMAAYFPFIRLKEPCAQTLTSSNVPNILKNPNILPARPRGSVSKSNRGSLFAVFQEIGKN